jgi:predicted RNA-binding protein YlxR (DUF448 family)
MIPSWRTKRIYKEKPGAAKREPQRTCVACRQVKAKRELVRVVRTPQGDIEIDITGKKEGRGAYICPSQECLEKALKGKQLEHVLKSSLTPANRDNIIKSGKELLKERSG